MTVVVADRVWERWRALYEESYKTSIDLLFSSDGDTRAVRTRLSRAVDRVISAFIEGQNDLPEGVDEPSPGVWSLAKVPEGVMVRVGEKCEAFEQLLQGVADELCRRGVAGRFDLYELPEVPQAPQLVDFVEARLRVNGERFPYHWASRWAAERDALWRVVDAAAAWCLENRPDRGVTLQAGTMPALPLRRGEDPAATLRETIGSGTGMGTVAVRSIGVERFRSVAIESSEGRVTVIEGGSVIARDGWRPTVEALRELVRVSSSDLVYAFVKRGAFTHEAELGNSFDRGWPLPREASLQNADEFENTHASAALGIQLLGPGFAGRIPNGPDWRQTALTADRVLLEHVDPDAWFRAPQLADVLRGLTQPPTDLLRRAQADFTPILLTAEIRREAYERRREFELRRPRVHLPDRLREQVSGFESTLVGVHRVALLLRDGRVVEDVDVGSGQVLRIAGKEDFELTNDEIADVVMRR